MESETIELKFKGQRRVIYKNPKKIAFRVGDFAVVQADKGIDIGQVGHLGSLMKKAADEKKLKEIIRRCTHQDFKKHEENRGKEKAALRTCKEKLTRHNLKMKLVDCEFQLDGKKITFHFTSENRVDFRKLVKDVAAVYRTRIEFRQIGVRDEARKLGGFGICGRDLCCSTWIRDFAPVTTQAARDQNLPLNPTKLAGVCGRLKCCLMYERGFYNEAIKKYPKLAKPIKTEKGEGIVSNIDIFAERVIVLYPDDTTETFALDYVKGSLYKCDHGCGHENGDLDDLGNPN